MRVTERQVLAEITLSDVLDRLVITALMAEDSYEVSRLLRERLPGVRVNQGSGGAWVASQHADALLSIGETDGFIWSAEARKVAENRRRARETYAGLREQTNLLRSSGCGLAEAHVSDMEGSEVLDAHQIVNVAAMTLPESYGLCVFDEQGAGKTVTFIFAFDLLVARDVVDFAIIVAPKSMVPEWERDFRRFKGDLYKIQTAIGTRSEKSAAIWSGADLLITNFETIVSMEAELTALLRRYQGRAVLAVDESFYVKSLDAKRTRALRRLREYCGRAFVLCGTPAPNSPHDLVQQFNIVDFGITFDGIMVPEDRTLARPVVQQAINERGVFLRHLKSEVLPDLPPKSFHRIIVSLEEEQRRLYEGALRGLIITLQTATDEQFQRHITSFLAKRSVLLQICSSPASVARDYSGIPAKYVALDSLLEELIARRGEKVVLWSFYTDSVAAMVRRYRRFTPVRYDGTVTDIAERREAVRRFQEDETTMLFVANPAAAGAGLTLHRARIAVYESMSNQAAHYLQSLDRIHRRGQDRGVEYIVLLCDQTIEIQEYEQLVAKERAAQELLGDQINAPLTRQSMLADALAALERLGDNSWTPLV